MNLHVLVVSVIMNGGGGKKPLEQVGYSIIVIVLYFSSHCEKNVLTDVQLYATRCGLESKLILSPSCPKVC